MGLTLKRGIKNFALSTSFSVPWGRIKKTKPELLPEPNLAGTLMLDVQPPELWETNFCWYFVTAAQAE